ncbi:histidine phosphatase family protein [Bacillus horti]
MNNTYIYMIRHGESPKVEGNERTRGLTQKGEDDARKITELLLSEGIDIFISSPYSRAILTIEELAKVSGKEVMVYEDLKELVFSSGDQIFPDNELYPLVNKMFHDPNLASPGGETLLDCQNRSIAILMEILSKYKGQRIILGTHGAIMTLMMGYFDSKYNIDFLMKTSKPDVYRMTFQDNELVDVKRLWQITHDIQ